MSNSRLPHSPAEDTPNHQALTEFNKQQYTAWKSKHDEWAKQGGAKQDTPTSDYWANHTCEMTCSHIRPEDWPKQDDQQLRKAIAVNMGLYYRKSDNKWLREKTSNGEYIGVDDMTAELNSVMKVVTTAQIQLVSELEKQGCSHDQKQLKAQGHEADNRYDANRLGRYIFIGDNDRLNNLNDLYWSYVMEQVAKDSAHYDHYTLDYCKRNMPYAGFDQVGIHKMLARADQFAKERLAQVTDMITPDSSQDTVTPSRPGEHKKQELERGK